MFKPFAFFFFLAVCVWLASIFVSTDPQVRLNRSCAPVGLVGDTAVAAVELFSEPLAHSTRKAFAQAVFGCKHIVWTLAYKEDWMRMEQLGQEIKGSPARKDEKSPEKK